MKSLIYIPLAIALSAATAAAAYTIAENLKVDEQPRYTDADLQALTGLFQSVNKNAKSDKERVIGIYEFTCL